MGSGLNRGHGGSEGMGASVDPPPIYIRLTRAKWMWSSWPYTTQGVLSNEAREVTRRHR